jgi:hypothetical protein
MHAEIPVKVNAWVDEKVAPLVDALNEFTCVVTLDSCQGDQDKPAHVMFRYIGGEQAAIDFFFYLGRTLGEKAAHYCEYNFLLRWLTGHKEPVAEIRTDQAYITHLATVVASLATTFRKTRS